ncbi:MAG: glycosyltransferase family 4 protein [Sedimentisphaerales bacterium]
MASELLHRGHDVQILYRKDCFSFKTAARYLFRRVAAVTQKDWLDRFEGKFASFKVLDAKLVGDGDVVMSVGPDCVKEMLNLPEKCGAKIFNVHGLTLRNPELRRTSWSEDIPKIAVSSYVGMELIKAGDNNVVAVVPNGIDISEYFPDGDHVERTGIGTVFGPGVAKDPETIISVFARLHELRPQIPLLCFGVWPRPEKLLSAVQYYRLPSVEQTRGIYSRCSVWFCASRSEGFGMPVLEAMACGCAVVTTDCGGPGDFVKSGINGVMVRKESPEEIIESILEISDDRVKQIRLATSALETVQTLSWSNAAQKMEAAMETVVSGRWRDKIPLALK